MGAFIVSGIVFAITLVVCILTIMANGMSDAPSQQGVSVWPTFIGGTLLAVAIAATHWLPHVSW